MNCDHCGKTVNLNAKFCGKCGAFLNLNKKIQGDSSQPTNSVEQAQTSVAEVLQTQNLNGLQQEITNPHEFLNALNSGSIDAMQPSDSKITALDLHSVVAEEVAHERVVNQQAAISADLSSVEEPPPHGQEIGHLENVLPTLLDAGQAEPHSQPHPVTQNTSPVDPSKESAPSVEKTIEVPAHIEHLAPVLNNPIPLISPDFSTTLDNLQDSLNQMRLDLDSRAAEIKADAHATAQALAQRIHITQQNNPSTDSAAMVAQLDLIKGELSSKFEELKNHLTENTQGLVNKNVDDMQTILSAEFKKIQTGIVNLYNTQQNTIVKTNEAFDEALTALTFKIQNIENFVNSQLANQAQVQSSTQATNKSIINAVNEIRGQLQEQQELLSGLTIDPALIKTMNSFNINFRKQQEQLAAANQKTASDVKPKEAESITNISDTVVMWFVGFLCGLTILLGAMTIYNYATAPSQKSERHKKVSESSESKESAEHNSDKESHKEEASKEAPAKEGADKEEAREHKSSEHAEESEKASEKSNKGLEKKGEKESEKGDEKKEDKKEEKKEEKKSDKSSEKLSEKASDKHSEKTSEKGAEKAAEKSGEKGGEKGGEKSSAKKHSEKE